MSTINANEYSATTQTVAAAIERSISHSEIVTIEAGSQREAIESQLADECEGSTPDAGEYWGENLDGEKWRVHVRDL